jgi:hypothetical protein
LTTDVSIYAISTPSDIVSRISVALCVARECSRASIIAMSASAIVLSDGHIRNDRERLKIRILRRSPKHSPMTI